MGISVFPVPASGLTQSQLLTEPAWTLLQTTSATNVTVLHITGLSGYNRYKVYVSNLLVTTNADKPAWFFNNDTSSHIVYQNFSDRQGVKQIQSSTGLTGYYYMTHRGWRNDGYNPLGYIEINNANSTSAKQIKHAGHVTDETASAVHFEGFGISTIAAPITQISVGMQFGGAFYMNQVYVYGAN